MSLTPDDIRAIVTAFDTSDWTELSLQHGDTRLEMSRAEIRTLPIAPIAPAAPAAPAAAELPAPATAPTPTAEPSIDVPPTVTPTPTGPESASEGVSVLAPTVGLFWKSPQPGAPPFVEVGQQVSADDTVCIVEVMKLMSHVKAGVAGVVIRVSVEDGAMVEHGDTLVIIAPAAA